MAGLTRGDGPADCLMEEYVSLLVEEWEPPHPGSGQDQDQDQDQDLSTLASLLAAETLGRDTTYEGRVFLAKVVEVHDGDTVRIRFWDRGGVVQLASRLLGVDAPELHPKRDSPTRDAEKAAALAAKESLSERVGGSLVIARCGPFDKYGRLLSTLYKADPLGRQEGAQSVNEWMIQEGHCKAYFGGKKSGFGA